MNTIPSKLEERLAPLDKRLEKLEKCLGPEGIKGIMKRCAEEDDIARELDTLAFLAMQAGDTFFRNVQKKLQIFATRLALLPFAPRIEVIKLLRSVLALKPLILVTDDTFNEVKRHLELTRICLLELTEKVSFDYQFPSFSHENEELQAMEEGDHGDDYTSHASLKQGWHQLQTMLYGRYVIAFDLPLVQLQLEVTAQEYGLPIPIIVGHSLLDLLLRYARIKKPIGEKLDGNAPLFSDTQLCVLLAKEDIAPFFGLTFETADQKALYLLHALRAMANGTFSLQEPFPISTLMQLPDPFSEEEL